MRIIATSGSGCEDSVGETCLVSCGDMRPAFRKQDRDRLTKEIACPERGFKDTTLVSSMLWKRVAELATSILP